MDGADQHADFVGVGCDHKAHAIVGIGLLPVFHCYHVAQRVGTHFITQGGGGFREQGGNGRLAPRYAVCQTEPC